MKIGFCPIVAAVAAVAAVFSFAPYGLWLLMFFALALLFWSLEKCANWQRAMLTGAIFGMVFFMLGLRWIWDALTGYIGLPVFAAAAVFILFCAFLSLYPALTAGLAKAIAVRNSVNNAVNNSDDDSVNVTATPFFSIIAPMLLLAGLWTLSEMLRGILFSGFPWLAAGYSQTPNSPLAGYLPLLGIDGVTLMLTISCALAAAVPTLLAKHYRKHAIAAAATIIIIFIGGAASKTVSWTQPVGMLHISLLQGNVKQDLKFVPQRIETALQDYLRLTKAAAAEYESEVKVKVESNSDSSSALKDKPESKNTTANKISKTDKADKKNKENKNPPHLIVLPETALPMSLDQLPATYWQQLRAAAGNGVVLAGMFIHENDNLYNAAVATTPGAPNYRKRHLTPYGEYLPFAALLSPLLLAAEIPFFGLTRGTKTAPLELAGAKLALSICYEDVFSNEWRRQLPQAEVLINMTNDGWFDNSDMARQHLQISQTRAAEFGRYLVRATNTGETAIINARGQITHRLAPQTQRHLSATIPRLQHATPYTNFGQFPTALLSLLLIAVAARRTRPAH